MSEQATVTTNVGAVLGVWRIDDSEHHWLLAADAGDAWRVYCETYGEHETAIEDVEIVPLSPALAGDCLISGDDGGYTTLLALCQREARRCVIASTCV